MTLDAQAVGDAVTDEILTNRFRAITEEMAATLLRTSGSPVLTEAHDFCTALFDAEGELIGFSGYVVAHVGSSTEGVRAVIREHGDDVAAGDAFICNDPYDSGAIHQGDVGIVSPLFWEDELVGWAFSNAHVLDVGGMSPGGWAPEAWDVYSEALRWPVARIVRAGAFVDDLVKLLLKNVRSPIVLNDIRSLVAANNTASSRLAALLDRYGTAGLRRAAAHAKDRSEQVVRERIRALPDGVYASRDWVEYDGHGWEALMGLRVAVVVDGDRITFDLTECAPQSDGFVNAGWGAVSGALGSVVLLYLAWDVPHNAGVLRPFDVALPAPGSVLNPVEPAAVSCGHMEGASRAGRAAVQALVKALALSADPALRARAGAVGINSNPITGWAGLDQHGRFTAFALMDASSGGLGAQSTTDGLAAGCYEAQLANGIPDVEVTEGFYPVLFLWRALWRDSAGPGRRRGGLGLDFAWTPWDTDGLLGSASNAVAAVPSRGALGGLPGATSHYAVARGAAAGGLPAAGPGEPLPGEEPLRNHAAGIGLARGDVFRQRTGGGGGLGDPRERAIAEVVADVSAGDVGATAAREVYGVALDRSGRPDAARTAQLRARRTTEAPLASLRLLADGTLSCAACAAPLAAPGESWKASATRSVQELSVAAARHGARVKRHDAAPLHLVAYGCPGCGRQLETDVVEQPGDDAFDLRPGAAPRPAAPTRRL